METLDLSYKDKTGKIDLRALITVIVQKLLGIALDNCRISGMSDRSFNQIQRTMKDSYYQILDFAVIELLKEGYIKPEEK